MSIDIETIKKIANLAAISFEENELEGFARDFDLIIGYMEQLSKIDTGDIKPMEHVLPVQNVFREDEDTNQNNRDELIKCAPVSENGCYIVPSVVES